MNGHTWIVVAGLALNLIVYLIAGTRQIARERHEIEARIEQARKEVNERREMDLRILSETMQAIRTKMSEMELWNRDNFARRDSVHTLTGRLETRLEALDEKISEAFERLNAKIDERTKGA
jgi:hypothetical protein